MKLIRNRYKENEDINMKRALIIIDLQKDFCDGGILPAKDTSSLIDSLNRFIIKVIEKEVICIFTRDWHPPDHYSFTENGGIWPVHCVQNSVGAEFADGLFIPDSSFVIDIEKDSSRVNMGYSAFENTNLDYILKEKSIVHLGFVGIATEYCVKASVIDALQLGYKIDVLTDLIRPIGLHPSDSSIALSIMKKAGAILTTSSEWL
jgi:nicotinamidase/pyrazinamidase